MKNFLSSLFGIAMSALMLLATLSGCKPAYPPNERLTLYATISADAKMIASLTNIGSEKVRLRVFRLDDSKDWQELEAPRYTTSIQFGLHGHELLLTHHVGDGEVSELSKWNLDDPSKGLQRIFQGNGLVFPIEVGDGRYLIRSCPLTTEQKCHPWFNVWQLVKQNKLLHAYTNERRLNYSWPNVVQGQGFFWMKMVGEYVQDEPFPSFRRIAFPDGNMPNFQLNELGPDTANIRCDFKTERCLRIYIKNWNSKKPGAYIYAQEVLIPNGRCDLSGVSGYFDEIFLTPDGNAAVMSLAAASDKPRHIVVAHFKPGQCEPAQIQHIYLEEGDK